MWVVCAPHHRGRDIPRRAGDIPEPVGDAPRHRPGMSPLAGDIPVGGSGIYYSQGYPRVFLGTFPPGRGYPRAVRRRPRLLAALKNMSITLSDLEISYFQLDISNSRAL